VVTLYSDAVHSADGFFCVWFDISASVLIRCCMAFQYRPQTTPLSVHASFFSTEFVPADRNTRISKHGFPFNPSHLHQLSAVVRATFVALHLLADYTHTVSTAIFQETLS